jgi:hypothetical protein
MDVSGEYVVIFRVKKKVKQETNNEQDFACCLLQAGLSFRLFFNSEDEGDFILRNVSLHSPDYTTFYPR